jgi:hypothetical protein
VISNRVVVRSQDRAEADQAAVKLAEYGPVVRYEVPAPVMPTTARADLTSGPQYAAYPRDRDGPGGSPAHGAVADGAGAEMMRLCFLCRSSTAEPGSARCLSCQTKGMPVTILEPVKDGVPPESKAHIERRQAGRTAHYSEAPAEPTEQ